MARAENDVTNIVRLALDKLAFILFRNNIGFDAVKKVKYGLKIGSGDWIGWQSIIITQDMVGKRIARFASVEMKAETDANEDQEKWLMAVREAGGIAFIARGLQSIPPDLSLPDA